MCAGGARGQVKSFVVSRGWGSLQFSFCVVWLGWSVVYMYTFVPKRAISRALPMVCITGC